MGLRLLFQNDYYCNRWNNDDGALDGKSALGGSNDMSSGHAHALWR